MAAILPKCQRYTTLLPSLTIGMHLLTLVSASDTFTVERLANSTASTSSKTLRRADGNTVTVTDDGAYTVTLVGTAGQDVLVVTSHEGITNYGPESA